MSPRFVVNYYLILYSVILLLVHSNLSTGEYEKNNYEQIETGSTTSVEKETVKAPLSFLPVCKPQQIHTFSQRQIRCACGVQCRYLCQTKATTSTEKKTGEEEQGKTCKRVCRQKPCYRPLSHTVYHYRLMDGLCQMWNVCAYRAKCEGKTRRWVQYHLVSCQRSVAHKIFRPIWMKNM